MRIMNIISDGCRGSVEIGENEQSGDIAEKTMLMRIILDCSADEHHHLLEARICLPNAEIWDM
jgi:hypothetical protein